eukprot:GHVN01092483.1.p1 GENE.GHVN01092483.1~~GHVN01092483.1.p1  ORF type:complete len:155 (+),score=23.70 GHVN01092483.1:132-596(+)
MTNTTHEAPTTETDRTVERPSVDKTAEETDPSEAGRVQVSMSRSRAFYVNVARRFFRGVDGKEPLNEVTLTALGSAISGAAGVSGMLESAGVATIKRVQTSYTDKEKDNKPTRTGRNLPRITITMEKKPGYKDDGDDLGEPAKENKEKAEATSE